MNVSTSLSSLFSSDIVTHIHTLNLTDNIRVLHTHMNTLGIIIVIVELIENIKLFFFKVFVFCQIFQVDVAYANLCCIIMELVPEVLLFAEP